MVDPVGTSTATKPVAVKERATRVAAPSTPVTAPSEPVREEQASPAIGLQSIARELAAKAPVDADRVARIRAAIQNRTYPILPETIADRLLALKLNWRPE